MIFVKQTISISLALLFIYAGIALAEGQWATNSEGDIYSTNPGGNVGIGTKSPGAKLDVEGGNIKIESSDAYTRLQLWNTGGGRHYQLLSGSNGLFGIYDMTSTDWRVSVRPDGDVGIGTTSPDSKMHLYSIDALALRIESSGAKNAVLDLRNSKQAWNIFSQGTTGNLVFDGGVSNTLVMDMSGRVGIGTTNPAGGLHVFRGNPTKLFIGHDASSGEVARAAVIEKQTSSPYHIDFFWSNNPTSNAGNLTFYSSRNTPRVVFKANGNVGIGTTNPGRSLEIISPSGKRTAYWKSGTSDGTSTFLIRNSDNTDLLDLDADGKLYLRGKVGVGTPSPSGELQVNSTHTVNLFLESTATNGRKWALESIDSGQFGIKDYAAGANRLMINGSGDVGIGTTNPAGGLHVFRGNPTKLFIGHDASSGEVARAAVIEKQTSSPYHIDFFWSNNPTSNAGNLTFYSSRNTPRVIFKANGNVGIGTTNPGRSLEIISQEGTRTAYWKSGSNDASSTFLIRNSDSTDLFDLGSDGELFLKGNVGIGAPDPTEKLDVKEGRLKTNMALSKDEDHHQFANNAGTVFGKIGLKYSTADLFIGTDIHPNLLLLDRSTGKVGIGTDKPQSKLSVNGTITAKEIKVESGWSDFVFDEDYELASLGEVESFIHENNHLPDVPSAKEVAQKGLAVSEMLAKQMQKIEELTLYLIRLEKENKALKAKNAEIEKRLVRLEEDG